MITLAMLVTDAAKEPFKALVNGLEETNYVLDPIRKVCPVSPTPTWQTPHTHWYMNDDSMTQADLDIIQGLMPYEGVMLFVAYDAANSLEWAWSNMASQGLQFVPDNPDI